MNRTTRPRVGVSACLLGRAVRHDGGHKRSRFLCEMLEPFVEWIPVCPEVEAGLPVPRESMRLVAIGAAGVRLLGTRSRQDHTDRMRGWAEERLDELARLDLDGYVLVKDSPSCGIERVRVYPPAEGAPARSGTGLFAAALRERLPSLPLSEQGWLNDAALAESFLVRVFAHNRLRTQLLAAPTRAGLVALHASYKYLYLAHSPIAYRRLGRMVAAVADLPIGDAALLYTREAMAALAVRATRGKHANVLEHILGHFKEVLPSSDRREVVDLIAEFRAGVHALAVPLALLAHHLRRSQLGGWLAGQAYFEPYPRPIGRPPVRVP